MLQHIVSSTMYNLAGDSLVQVEARFTANCFLFKHVLRKSELFFATRNLTFYVFSAMLYCAIEK